MKIIQIITSSKCWAGMEQYAFDVSREMIVRGHEVAFVIANDGDVVYPRFEKIGKVYLLPMKSKFDFKSIRELKKIIRIENPDIIHTHQPKNIFHAHWGRSGNRRIKIVHTVHFLINPTSPQALYSWIFGKLARVIAVSEQVKRRTMEVYPKLNPNRVVTILNSIDTSRFAGENKQETPAENSHKTITIGYAGRLVEDKGVEVLLRAARTVRSKGVNFKLLLAGTGSEEYVEKLNAMTTEFDLTKEVEFIGFVSDMSDFMKRIDIAVAPSIVREACSLMVLEYMFNSKAIIASNNGGQPEVIDSGKNGILVDPNDDGAIAENLIRLIDDQEHRERIKRAAKEKFDSELSFPKFIDETTRVYEQALQENN